MVSMLNMIKILSEILIFCLYKRDKQLPKLDVIDDFRNERLEIRRAKGASYPFTFGDYVVKSLIGSIDPELDSLDEKSECCCLC